MFNDYRFDHLIDPGGSLSADRKWSRAGGLVLPVGSRISKWVKGEEEDRLSFFSFNTDAKFFLTFSQNRRCCRTPGESHAALLHSELRLKTVLNNVPLRCKRPLQTCNQHGKVQISLLY